MSNRQLTFICLLFITSFLVTTQSIANTTELVGQTQGQFRVDESGAATYQLPLNIPAGRAGVTPSIGLAYSSGNTMEGPLGVGWSLTGLSSITRCPATPVQDNKIAEVQYNSSDYFCLDGQRLELISGSYGSYNSTYRTEIDSFQIIKVEAMASNGPKYFSVKNKAGETWYYGDASSVSTYFDGAADAFVEPSDPAMGDVAKSWALKAIVDVKGNFILFEYDDDRTKGSFYIEKIRYAGKVDALAGGTPNVIEFIYTDYEKGAKGYAAGSAFSNDKLLTRIDAKIDSESFRSYHLNYERNNFIEDRTLLEEITECNDANKSFCFKPLTFEWNRPALKTSSNYTACAYQSGFSSYCYSSPYSNNYDPFDVQMTNHIYGSANPQSSQIFDIDGDGINDIMYVHSGNWKVRFGPNYNTAYTLSGIGDNKASYAQSIDHDGDGVRELLVADSKTSYWYVIGYSRSGVPSTLCPSNDNCQQYTHASNLYVKSLGVIATGLEGEAQVLDVNGDAMEDIVFRTGGYIKAHTNDGDGTFTANRTLYTYPSTPTYTDFPGDLVTQTGTMKAASAFDINGDGRSDLIVDTTTTVSQCLLYGMPAPALNQGECELDLAGTWTSTTTSSYSLYKSTNTMSSPQLTIVQSLGSPASIDTIRAADLNGDGLSDILYVKNNRWYYRLSDGTQLLPERDSGLTTTSTKKHYSQFVDLNADGRADILHATSTSNWDIYFSRPTQVPDWIAFEKRGAQSFTNNAHIRFGDYNGDGKIDLFTSNGTNKWTVHRNRIGIKEYAINRITSSYGVNTDITYNLLTESSTYVMQASDYNTSYDTFSPVMPMHVVSKVDTDSNVGSAVSVSYEYGGLLIHKKGRGMLGFQMLRTTDNQTNVKTETHYAQDFSAWTFAKARMPRYTEQTRNGTLMSKSQNTLAVLNTVYLKTYFPYVQSSVEHSYVYDSNEVSTLLSTTTTTNSFDYWGNLTSNNVQVLDNNPYTVIETDTVNTYGTGVQQQLGRLLSTTVTKKRTGLADVVRTSNFTYNSDNMLATTTVAPGTSKQLLTTYTYDTYGNKTKVRVEGNTTSTGNSEFRETETIYANNGRHISSTKNALGETTTFKYDNTPPQYFNGTTNSMTVTDPNGLSITTNYNKLGQKTNTETLDYRDPAISYAFCNSSCGGAHPNAYIKITHTEGGKPTRTVYSDKWGREVAKSVVGFDGSLIYTKTDYDAQGRVWRQYEPGSFSAYFTETTYDVLGRPENIKQPNNGNITQTIQGRTTITTDELGQETHVTVNGFGETVKTEDAILSRVEFEYDAHGQMLQAETIAGSKSSIVSTEYDDWGRKTKTIDPIKGTWEYSYNAFGELYTQKTARNHTFTFYYDKLGRKKRSYEPNEGTLCWNYGSSVGTFGKLTSSYKYDGVNNSYCWYGTTSIKTQYYYDTYGRLDETKNTVSGTVYTQKQEYDNYSRPTVTEYPTGTTTFKTKQLYNIYGYAYKTVDYSNNTNGTAFQTIIDIDDRGQVTQVDYGNGTSLTSTYQMSNGWVTKKAVSGPNMSVTVDTTFDLKGNVTSRESTYGSAGSFSGSNFTENYFYDAINRLTSRTFSASSGASFLPSAFQANITYAYDGFGNFTRKSDKGYYKYNATKVHQLEGIYNYCASATTCYGNQNTFTYDDNGNVLSDGDRSYTYDSFDKPTYISKLGVNSTMKYGVNRELYYKEDNYTENGAAVNYKRTYLGSYEKVVRTGGAGNRTEHKYYVGNVVVTKSASNSNNYYTYTDHQGSVIATAGNSGHTVSKAIYDPFGKRSAIYETGALANAQYAEPTEKGYTGHTEMAELGIIHMGGRIYDASFGRFLQADPIVQAPHDSQSYNRFAYVRNNPITLTDPSGYSWWSKTWKKLRPYVGLIAMAIPVIREWAIAGPGHAFLFGAAAGGISTGSLRGALIGGLSGLAFHHIGASFDGKVDSGWFAENGFGHVFTHAFTGGVVSELQGGKFGHGFFSAGVAKAANVNDIFGTAAEDATLRIVTAAIIGGTVSELTGGKFKNGAATAAFAQAFNGEASADKKELEKVHFKIRMALYGDDKPDYELAIEIAMEYLGLDKETYDIVVGSLAQSYTDPNTGKAYISPDDMKRPGDMLSIIGHEAVHIDQYNEGILAKHIYTQQGYMNEVQANQWEIDNKHITGSIFAVSQAVDYRQDNMSRLTQVNRGLVKRGIYKAN